MKRLATLMMAVIPFVALCDVVNATEEEPDPLAADTQLIILDTDSIVSHQSTNDEETVHDYQYGDKPDIQEVISVKTDSMACGLTPAVMTYADSHGEKHTLRYQVMGNGCQNG